MRVNAHASSSFLAVVAKQLLLAFVLISWLLRLRWKPVFALQAAAAVPPLKRLGIVVEQPQLPLQHRSTRAQMSHSSSSRLRRRTRRRTQLVRAGFYRSSRSAASPPLQTGSASQTLLRQLARHTVSGHRTCSRRAARTTQTPSCRTKTLSAHRAHLKQQQQGQEKTSAWQRSRRQQGLQTACQSLGQRLAAAQGSPSPRRCGLMCRQQEAQQQTHHSGLLLRPQFATASRMMVATATASTAATAGRQAWLAHQQQPKQQQQGRCLGAAPSCCSTAGHLAVAGGLPPCLAR